MPGTAAAVGGTLSYPCTVSYVPVRKRRSISIPPDLDASIEEAAKAAGTTYSGWLAAAARKELTLRAGLAAVAAYERDEGAFRDDEIAEAEPWARHRALLELRQVPTLPVPVVAQGWRGGSCQSAA